MPAPSPPPLFEAPLPAYVGRSPAAEAEPTPPSVEPAPAFPVPRVLLSLSPVAAASWPWEMKKVIYKVNNKRFLKNFVPMKLKIADQEETSLLSTIYTIFIISFHTNSLKSTQALYGQVLDK